MMKTSSCVQLPRVVVGKKTVFQWSFEPARESGLDIATNLKLSLLNTRGRLLCHSMSPGYTSSDVYS